VFVAQVLVGPSKQLKQTFQIEHNIVKNPNWREANQFATFKRGWGFELRAIEKQIQVVVRAGLEPVTAGLRVRHADHSTTLPQPCCEIVHNATAREFTTRCNTCWKHSWSHRSERPSYSFVRDRKTETIRKKVSLLVRSPQQVIVFIFIPLIFSFFFPASISDLFFSLCYLFPSIKKMRSM